MNKNKSAKPDSHPVLEPVMMAKSNTEGEDDKPIKAMAKTAMPKTGNFGNGDKFTH